MPQIRFLRIIHNQTPVVQIEFANYQTIIDKLKVATKTRWGATRGFRDMAKGPATWQGFNPDRQNRVVGNLKSVLQPSPGINSSNTTKIYTVVSIKNLNNIKNPPDDFDL